MCDDIHAILQGNWALFEIVCYISPVLDPGGGGGTPHMKGVGMLVGNCELNP